MALFGNQFALPLIWFSSLHSCGCVSLSSLIWSAVLLERLRHAFQVLVFISVSRHPSNGCFVVYGLNSDLIWTPCFLGSLLLSILQSETCPMSFCFVILCPVSLSLSFGLLCRILQLPSWRMILIPSVAPMLAWQRDQHRWFHVQNQESDDSQKRPSIQTYQRILRSTINWQGLGRGIVNYCFVNWLLHNSRMCQSCTGWLASTMASARTW